ncbi:uncharacterized protein LOC141621416 [Silene latifolia]|uniref:uncharacterized protein LOC141621416 n=1 Tax=Silene latifolia TaxID=37657 RepID=UPI003D76B925
MLRRKDIMSLMPENLMSLDVIECWSILMNHLEKEEYGDQMRMSFFGIRHMDLLLRMLGTFEQPGTQSDSNYDDLYQIWDTFIVDSDRTVNLKTDLLFVPFCINDHFACVCINHKSNTVDLLDGQRHSNLKKSQFGKAARLISSAVSDYLESRDKEKKNTRAREIPNYVLRQIPFSGMSPTLNQPESGLFTMMAMLLYEGLPFQHEDLEKKKSRRYLVIQLVATSFAQT